MSDGPSPPPVGYTIRRCTNRDVEGVMAFHEERTGAADAEDFGLVAHDPTAGPGWTAIAVHEGSGTIAASLTLLDEHVRIGSVPVAAGQVEMVASDPAHAGLGLVRSLMQWSESESRRRGHLIQPMVGIPFFYRQFGYRYSSPLARWATLDAVPETHDQSWRARRAVADDVGSIRVVIQRELAAADIAMAPSLHCVDWIVRRRGSDAWVVERDGHVRAFGRSLPNDEGSVLGDVFADHPDAAVALVNAIGRPGLAVQHRPSTSAGQALRPWLSMPAEDRHAEWLYARIPEVTALLEHLRPELQRRLDASHLAGCSLQLEISSYRFHVSTTIDEGRIGSFSTGGPMQSPVSRGGAGIPPDLWAPLLLGPYGADGLELRHPDVLLGDVRELMTVLFPPMTAEFVTFYMTT